MRTVLAADLGGTKCRFALVAEDLEVIGASNVPTTRDRDAFLAAMDGAFRELRSSRPAGCDDPVAVGIGAAGVVRADGRALSGAPNLPIDGFALGEHLEREHGLPATLVNDGRASAWGEYLRGHAKERDPLLVLFFGTGIGIGMISGGRPYAGASNAAGEVGHTVHVPGGRQCVCGNRGCYEAYCGGGLITARAAEEIGPPPEGDRWTVTVLRKVAAENDAARRILDEAETAFCAMVASLCTLLNPAAVVLGGGVLTGWPELRGSVERFAREWCTPPVRDAVEFVPSMGGSDAILWGAAKATGKL